MNTILKDPADIATETSRQQATKQKFNPMDGIKQVPYPRHLVEAIDTLIEYKRKLGVPDHVDSEAGWNVVIKTFEIWQIAYPHEYRQFFESQKETWANLANDYGSAKGTGGSEIRKIMEIPELLYKMIKIMFPNQKWDTKFMKGLVTRIPLLRGYRKR